MRYRRCLRVARSADDPAVRVITVVRARQQPRLLLGGYALCMGYVFCAAHHSAKVSTAIHTRSRGPANPATPARSMS